MSLPRSAADVLGQHVTLEVECIDRMYLNVYQPRLQYNRGVVKRGSRGSRVMCPQCHAMGKFVDFRDSGLLTLLGAFATTGRIITVVIVITVGSPRMKRWGLSTSRLRAVAKW